jgi:hypothetical protein
MLTTEERRAAWRSARSDDPRDWNPRLLLELGFELLEAEGCETGEAG